jgi:glyoxylase-like metal-dependent hydrolase (beta-lactamase superfamily II)
MLTAVTVLFALAQAPIRYLVYSHHHDDHVSGGKAFGDRGTP